jgi:hypothetical protein
LRESSFWDVLGGIQRTQALLRGVVYDLNRLVRLGYAA